MSVSIPSLAGQTARQPSSHWVVQLLFTCFNPLISGADRATDEYFGCWINILTLGFNPLISGADRATH